ncbi:hypothetical protein HELRODRAFT_71023 [Helobdella robusta]|uniref:G-protein coupled receptors family 2 profile 2 domain-containing protein n=1 Tax=Helobdella robusta TaxID=6412 RepID=T1G0F9_HELRO|nr:hypothetical protein HELRODRAFT_71023 [Helobdella robusta]ESN90609.1 hypothetical protein HELRODRAFT_71023 [Helobdella robusta]
MSEKCSTKPLPGNHCRRMPTNSCLSGSTSHSLTSFYHLSYKTQEEVDENLSRWQNIRNVPKCWDAIRLLLCTVFLPNCQYNSSSDTSRVQLPDKELCKKVKEPCKLIDELKLWPRYLQCDKLNTSTGCLKEIKFAGFQTPGTCVDPLTISNNSKLWYSGFEGCSLKCQNPWFDDNDHVVMHTLVALLAIICMICNVFAIITFILNWSHLNVFPDNIIFHLNICFFVCTCFWLVQFVPGLRYDVMCNPDDDTPVRTDALFRCSLTFMVIYFFSFASLLWLSVLAYTWHKTFEKSRESIRRKKVFLHVGVWAVTVVLTVLSVALVQLEGNTLTGICFISSVNNITYKFFLILVPFVIVWFLSLYFFFKGQWLFFECDT